VNLDRDGIFDVLRAAAQDLNATQPAHTPFEPREETLLNADGGDLSSLAVVTFILAVEERLSEALSRTVLVFDDSLIADRDGPFRTTGSLADHILTLVRTTSA
jgi:acyl carrier protein